MGDLTKPRVILGRDLIGALAAAGIITDLDTTQRVVIDAKADGFAQLYIHRYGDQRLLQVTHTLEGVKIERIDDAPPGQGGGG